MKAILVINMPRKCCECPCFYNYTCLLTKKELGIMSSQIGRYIDICPLKPVPQKKKSKKLKKKKNAIPIKWLKESKEWLDLDLYEDKIKALIDKWKEDNEEE